MWLAGQRRLGGAFYLEIGPAAETRIKLGCQLKAEEQQSGGGKFVTAVIHFNN